MRAPSQQGPQPAGWWGLASAEQDLGQGDGQVIDRGGHRRGRVGVLLQGSQGRKGNQRVISRFTASIQWSLNTKR